MLRQGVGWLQIGLDRPLTFQLRVLFFRIIAHCGWWERSGLHFLTWSMTDISTGCRPIAADFIPLCDYTCISKTLCINLLLFHSWFLNGEPSSQPTTVYPTAGLKSLWCLLAWRISKHSNACCSVSVQHNSRCWQLRHSALCQHFRCTGAALGYSRYCLLCRHWPLCLFFSSSAHCHLHKPSAALLMVMYLVKNSGSGLNRLH